MKKILLVLCVILSGCENLEVAVSTGTLYCSLVPADVRAAALARMQSSIESYPDHSICDTRGFIVDFIAPTE